MKTDFIALSCVEHRSLRSRPRCWTTPEPAKTNMKFEKGTGTASMDLGQAGSHSLEWAQRQQDGLP
jgi:hypothetical protein